MVSLKKAILLFIIIIAVSISAFCGLLVADKYIISDKKYEFDNEIIIVSGFDGKGDFTSPFHVVNLNNLLVKMIFNNIKSFTLDELVQKQRFLFSEKLLKENTKEKQLGEYKTQVEVFVANKTKLMYTHVDDIIYDTQNICYVVVTYAFNNLSSYKYKYCLIKEDDNYKILSWEKIEDLDEKN